MIASGLGAFFSLWLSPNNHWRPKAHTQKIKLIFCHGSTLGFSPTLLFSSFFTMIHPQHINCFYPKLECKWGCYFLHNPITFLYSLGFMFLPKKPVERTERKLFNDSYIKGEIDFHRGSNIRTTINDFPSWISRSTHLTSIYSLFSSCTFVFNVKISHFRLLTPCWTGIRIEINRRVMMLTECCAAIGKKRDY